jgi:diguanylate cyclase (GGDEF)-like protein
MSNELLSRGSLLHKEHVLRRRPGTAAPVEAAETLNRWLVQTFHLNTVGLIASLIAFVVAPAESLLPSLRGLLIAVGVLTVALALLLSVNGNMLHRAALSATVVVLTNLLITGCAGFFFRSHQVSMLMCGWFALLAIYIALAHSVRMTALSVAWSLVTIWGLTIHVAVQGPSHTAAASALAALLTFIVVVPPLIIKKFMATLQSTVETFTELSAIDFLTGVLNRRGLVAKLPAVVEAARRANRHVLVAVADLDKFKLINDTYGHDVGDMVIVAVARGLSAAVSQDGLVARVGGEEYIVADVVDPDAHIEGVQRLYGATLTTTGSVASTASVGAVVCPPSVWPRLDGTHSPDFGSAVAEDPTAHILAAADRAMYLAKRAGGDRAVIGSSPVQASASGQARQSAA